MKTSDFIFDNHTLIDLQLISDGKNNLCVFDLFNNTHTYGGNLSLLYMFKRPFCDDKLINQRIGLLKEIEINGLGFEIEKEAIDFIEFYLSLSKPPVRFSCFIALANKIDQMIKPTNDYYVIQRGVIFIIELVNSLYKFASSNIDQKNRSDLLRDLSEQIIDLITYEDLEEILTERTITKLTIFETQKLDHFFRFLYKDKINALLSIVYQLDVFNSIVLTKKKYNFVYPEISENQNIQIEGLHHPLIVALVKNNLILDEDQNVCFFTGANMAGKSTFMKAFGIAVYLAHLGFPVPVAMMKLPVFNGLLATINLSDNQSLGYSHFYAEVKRLKFIAENLATSSKMVIIIDELFRGTNNYDSHESTLAVVKAFSQTNDNLFLVSSHLPDVARELADIPNVTLKCFISNIENEDFVYSYKIKDGISDDRYGMRILKKEKIIELIGQE